MDVFRQELNAFPLRALLDQAAEELGERGLDDVLRRYSVTRADISDYSVWVSVAFVEAVLAEIVARLDDPGFIARAASRGVTRRYMGPLYPLLVGVGSPLFVYKQLPGSGGRVDKLGRWRFENPSRGHVRLIWAPVPGAKSARFLCEFKRHQLSRAPTFFSRPAATVAHPSCTFDGAHECVFDITWADEPARPQPRWGLLLGSVVGASSALAWSLSGFGVGACTLGFALGGWALGKVLAQRDELQTRIKDIDDHNRALEQVTKKNEQRYAELLEAKAGVEMKVDQRTQELRLTTQQLSETLKQVQELDKAKTTFFSNVSHDLRTPLTLILGPLGEMAQGREPPGGLENAVDVMQRNAARLLDLINQLLDLAKIDAGKMQIARVPTDLVELARTVERRFAAAASQQDLTLRTVAGAITPIAVDSAWIENALTNLVANALRFARSVIEIHVREEDGVVLIEVQDDGTGIAPEDLPSMFDRFAQGSDAQARKGGTGLGLAIVREAARLHGGDASVRSAPGATRFTLTLPRAMTANAAGQSVREPASNAESLEATAGVRAPVTADHIARPRATAEAQLEWPGPDPSAPLIVVAEDDDDLRAFTSQVLASTYRVRATRNGEEALALIAEVHPDAVVSDVVMPRMDGYELCKALRKRDDTRTLPVILLTARRDVGRVLEGFEAGADDYVTKPFQARELLARVNVHVRLRRIVSEMAHRERLASLGVLAASLAHQVRNPLNAILAGLPAVRRKLAAAMAPRDDDMFAAMIDSGERINTLIKDLMDLSRVDQEVVTRFRPADGVRACMRLIEARIQGAVQMDAELDDTVEIEGKAGDLSHVFLNLIDNAVRAAEPAGRIQLTVERRGGYVVFEIGDSGAGIPTEKQEAVFAPFYTTRAAGEGTGLGLAIARQVIIQHGGTIGVGRSPLGGALFTVSIPSALAAQAAAASPTVH